MNSVWRMRAGVVGLWCRFALWAIAGGGLWLWGFVVVVRLFADGLFGFHAFGGF